MLSTLTLLAVCGLLGVILGHWNVILIVGLIVLIVVAAAAVPTAFWVLAPGVALIEAVNGMETSDVERLAVAHRAPRELRQLIECINGMAATLQSNTFFLADVAHQLRTELQLMQIRLERLGGHVSAEGMEIHARAMADVERLHNTLTEHLELARMIEASPPVEVDICGVVLERARAWRDIAARHNVKIRTLLNGSPVALMRRGTLEQLLDILLDNAVRHSPRSGTIIVTVHLDKQHSTLHVLDEGSGMTAEERERATVRGWRGDHAEGEGRGLGLSIANMLVSSNGGRFALDAGPRGCGVDVRSTFPIVHRDGSR
ncbi:sensor histidine kinase [Streptosporangium sp. NPDC001559]|uniref:sensor histidine kinase n=1 Tax=Streptosporangium sp. NPDC001559 TaxID=3366187 RepID=UPI0036F0E7FF